MTGSTTADAARESARHGDGRFGEQQLDDPGVMVLPAADDVDAELPPLVCLGGEPDGPASEPDQVRPPVNKRGMIPAVAAPFGAAAFTVFAGGSVGAQLGTFAGTGAIVGIGLCAIMSGWLLNRLVDMPDW